MHSRIIITGVVVLLAVLLGGLSLLWPLRPEITPGGVTIDVEERLVLTEVPESYSSEEAHFAVSFKNVVTPYRVMAMFVMPAESVTVAVHTPGSESLYEIEAGAGTASPAGDRRWTWRAPQEPGWYPIHVDERPSGASLTLNVFVMRPYSVTQNELNGYMIGHYAAKPYKGDSAYLPPKAIVEVTPEVMDVLVSPHFRLGQFLCKQEDGFPKYLIIDERLLLKLEMLLKEVNELGIQARSLHVMSAFRTPFYNKLIGNETTYSQHLYGGAADVFVDSDEDSYMDDLNGDGTVTREDAVFMARIIENQKEEPRYGPLTGGLGIYSPAAHRGPFIHVDVRGTAVRW
jgi:hypothetical protein